MNRLEQQQEQQEQQEQQHKRRRKVVRYLNEAHASERALTRVLQAQIAMAPRGSYRSGLETHLGETRAHAERVERRVAELGDGSGRLVAVVGVAESVLGQALAVSRTPWDLVRGSGGEEKLLKNAKDACATEALEIATYTAIERLAGNLGDRQTAELAAAIRVDEEKMLARVMREIPKLTDAVVRAEIDGKRSYELADTGAGEAVRDTTSATIDGARDATAATMDTARKTAAAIVDAARKTASVTIGAARNATGATKDAAREAGEATKDAAREAGEATKDAARKTTAAANGAGEVVREAGEATRDAARDATAATKHSARQARKLPGVARAEGQVKGAVASEADLAIARYDTLTADEIASRLTGLSQIELAKVDSYERKHQDRSTVLRRIDSLRASEPWAGYDELTGAEVQAALAEGGDERAEQVRSYERAHKNRAGVLKAAEQHSNA